MSHVADIILSTCIRDGSEIKETSPNVEKLNNYLKREHNGASLIKVDEGAGGNKVMQRDVFMAAINYLDIPGFVRAFNEVKWEIPV